MISRAVFVFLLCSFSQKGFTLPASVPSECYGGKTSLPCSNCSNLDPFRSLYTNLTLWMVFNSTTFGGISPIKWTHCYLPNTNLHGHLQHIGGVLYNASLQINLTSVDFGRYVVKVNNQLLQEFVVTRNPKCFHQKLQVRNITSPAVVPSLPGRNITISCYFKGYAHDPTMLVPWKSSIKPCNSPSFYKRKQVDDTSCTFYSQLVIMNATSDMSDNYTCEIYINSGLLSSMTTELSIIDLPQFISYPRIQQYSETDPVSLNYIIQGERVYVNPNLTINGTEQLHKYCRPWNRCNVTITENQGHPQIHLSLNIAGGTLQPATYIVRVCAYLNSETVSWRYAEEYNSNPTCSELALTIQNEEWKTISIAGVGALFLLITMALTAVVCYRRRKRRKGYNHIPGNNTAANVEQPVSHNDSPETDGPSRHKACRKVFIVYHKDSHITEIQIEGLCDILNKLAKGFVCDCDVLHRTEPGINWNNWTERMIEEADFVLLVCSPQLYGCLSQAKSSPLIHTAVAVISGAAIANLCSISTDSSKFIPVFLNQNVDRKFVPNSLKSHKVYELITTGLMKIPSNGIPADKFHQEIQEYLDQNDRETKDLLELVVCLRQ